MLKLNKCINLKKKKINKIYIYIYIFLIFLKKKKIYSRPINKQLQNEKS
jgi:hypothetical protein